MKNKIYLTIYLQFLLIFPLGDLECSVFLERDLECSVLVEK
jgi:hypothetical protein